MLTRFSEREAVAAAAKYVVQTCHTFADAGAMATYTRGLVRDPQTSDADVERWSRGAGGYGADERRRIAKAYHETLSDEEKKMLPLEDVELNAAKASDRDVAKMAEKARARRPRR